MDSVWKNNKIYSIKIDIFLKLYSIFESNSIFHGNCNFLRNLRQSSVYKNARKEM